MRAWRDQSGASLIELAILVAILALVSHAVIAALGNALAVSRAQGAADQVAGALHLARMYAISNFATYEAELNPTTVAVSCDAGCPANAPSQAATPIVHGATISDATITFQATGTASPPTLVTVTYPGAPAWQVEVTAAGRIRTCTPACT